MTGERFDAGGSVRRVCRHCLFPILWDAWDWYSRPSVWIHVSTRGRHCAWQDTLAEPVQ